jgi:hypothetical protein
LLTPAIKIMIRGMEIVARKSVDSRSAESCEPVVRLPCDAPEVAPRKGRSRVTNGSVLIPGVDGRSPWIRRCKDVIASHISDLGGIDNCSTAERSIVRRASVMTVELERLEAKFARAGEADANELDQYARVAANLRRLLEAVGLGRRPRDISVPTLNEIAREIEDEKRSVEDVA